MTAPRKPQQFYKPGANAGLTLGPQDVLPKEAKLDKRYDANKPAFAMSQDPGLAADFGVIRNGQRILPSGAVSAVAAPAPVPAAPPPPPPAPKPVEAAPKPSIIQEAPKEEPAVKEEDEEPDDGYGYDPAPPMAGTTDLAQIREAVISQMLSSHEQRKIVESRLKGEITITDMLRGTPFRQTAVIIPERFEVTFESLDYTTESLLKQMIAEEAEGPILNEYLLDKYVLLGVAASVYAINGELLPSYRNEKGELSTVLLRKKLNWFLNRPTPLISVLSIQFSWFHERCMRVLQAVNLKNG